MTEGIWAPGTDVRHFLDVEALREWVEKQRWYASKSRHVTGIELLESVVLAEQPTLLLASKVDVVELLTSVPLPPLVG